MTKDVAVKVETKDVAVAPFSTPEDVMEDFSVDGFPQITLDHGSDKFSVNNEEADKVAGFIISVQKRKSYYSKPYKEGEAVEPDCYSLKCDKPGADSVKPQSEFCDGCPQNEWGSSSSGKGKACSDRRLLHLLIDGQDLVHELSASASSIKNIDSFVSKISTSGKYYQYVPVEITAVPMSKVYSIIAIKPVGYIADNKSVTKLISKIYTDNKKEMLERF